MTEYRFWTASSGDSAEAPFRQRTAEIHAEAGVVIAVEEICTDPAVNEIVSQLGRTAFFGHHASMVDMDTIRAAQIDALAASDALGALLPHYKNERSHVLIGPRGAFTVDVTGNHPEATVPDPLGHPAAEAQFEALAGAQYVILAHPIEIELPANLITD